jgi:hypothetical protein
MNRFTVLHRRAVRHNKAKAAAASRAVPIVNARRDQGRK